MQHGNFETKEDLVPVFASKVLRSRPIVFKKVKKSERVDKKSSKVETALEEMCKKMDQWNEVLLAIQKQSKEAAKAKNGYRLLKLMARKSL